MTFQKIRKREMLREKPNRVVFVLVLAIAAVSVGYIMTLAILAPQQLAEATTAATDLVCSGCVGTSDIASSAVTSAKIGSGQVGNTDIADSAVTSAKIGSGQVGTSDIATSAVTTGKISDTNGVYSVDIVNGQVGSADIADGTITSTDIASGAIQPNVKRVIGPQVTVPPGDGAISTIDCPTGTILTGGGYNTDKSIQVYQNVPIDENTWTATGWNYDTEERSLTAYALCVGATP